MINTYGPTVVFDFPNGSKNLEPLKDSALRVLSSSNVPIDTADLSVIAVDKKSYLTIRVGESDEQSMMGSEFVFSKGQVDFNEIDEGVRQTIKNFYGDKIDPNDLDIDRIESGDHTARVKIHSTIALDDSP